MNATKRCRNDGAKTESDFFYHFPLVIFEWLNTFSLWPILFFSAIWQSKTLHIQQTLIKVEFVFASMLLLEMK